MVILTNSSMREPHSRKDQKMASLLVQNTWLMTLIVTINRSYNNFPLSCFFFSCYTSRIQKENKNRNPWKCASLSKDEEKYQHPCQSYPSYAWQLYRSIRSSGAGYCSPGSPCACLVSQVGGRVFLEDDALEGGPDPDEQLVQKACNRQLVSRVQLGQTVWGAPSLPSSLSLFAVVWTSLAEEQWKTEH